MSVLLLILLPIVFGIISYLLDEKNSKQISFIGAALSLFGAFYMTGMFTSGNEVAFSFVSKWLPQYKLYFNVGLDGVASVLILLTTIVCIFALWLVHFNNYTNKKLYTSLILFAEGALIGVFAAQNPFSFYIFYELALIPMYFLSGIWGSNRKLEVTFKFVIYTIVGSLLMLAALVYIYSHALLPLVHWKDLATLQLDASTQCYIAIALFVAFAIKAPIFPFHTWQADLYNETSAPTTMILGALMSKLGLIGILRLLIPITPLCVGPNKLMFIGLCVTGILFGAIIALRQNGMRKIMAYSSLSHIGLIAAGLFAMNIKGDQGAVVQMFAHGINVAGLFFIIDIIQRKFGSTQLQDLGGLANRNSSLAIYFFIIVLGAVALPLTNGFVGEFLILWSLSEVNIWMAAIATLTIIFGAVYMLRMFQLSMFGAGGENGKVELHIQEHFILIIFCVFVIVFGLFPNSLTQFLA